MSVCRVVAIWAGVAGWDVTKKGPGVNTNTFQEGEKDGLERGELYKLMFET